jgi:D-alanine-D-alanine ligase
MKIGVTYDLRSDHLALGLCEEDCAEFDAEETVQAICDALVHHGHAPDRIGGIKALTARLAAGDRWDAVFNFCEGLKGVAREAQAPALLEGFDIPYVFSDPLTLALSLDKAMAKRVVRDGGVAVAGFAVVERAQDARRVDLSFPLFCKPLSEGSGKGVGVMSRVDDAAGLLRTVTYLLERFRQPVLVEEFLPGREFTVGITGTGDRARVLGVVEIVQKAGYVGHGYGLENKQPNWEDKLDIVRATDADARAAGRVALDAWRLLRCRDGGRVDVREDAAGRPCFIEVNPLAGLRPGYSDFCLIAEYEGLSYNDLIGLILASFLERHPDLKGR